VAQSDFPSVSTRLPSACRPSFNATILEAHHRPAWYKASVLRLNAHLRREIAGSLKPEEMTQSRVNP
jgi:hypothetical protein